jgi:hypothetical protein
MRLVPPSLPTQVAFWHYLIFWRKDHMNTRQLFVRLLFCFVLFSTFFTRFQPADASSKSVINLALNKVVTTDSNVSGGEPTRAIDGENYATSWVSANTASAHWLEVNLATSYNIDTVVVIKGDGSSLKNYRIEYWNGSGWSTASTVTNSPYSAAEHSDVLRFAAVTTSRVRIYDTTNVQTRLREIQIFQQDPQPIYVNQSGYELNKPKRFTAPLAANGTAFAVTAEANTTALFSGTINNGIGDFSGFNPSGTGPYVVRVGGSVSVAFGIGAYWVQRVSLKAAIDFMIDSRCRNGNASPVGPGTNCTNGVAWRDDHQFSFEVPNLIAMYAANPDAYSTARMPVTSTYSNLRQTLPADTPEIVRLIYWGVEIFLQGDVNHTLLKEQLAYFVYAYPGLLDQYIPVEVYNEARDYVFNMWGSTARDRWNWYDIAHTADLFQTYTVYDTSGKGAFPPGHSIIPNLLMYEIALREGRSDAQLYMNAAINNASYIISNLAPSTVTVTKGQRMSEPVLIPSLVYFYKQYPSQAPAGLVSYVQQWATTMIGRSNNAWDFRKYSDTTWIIPGYNEPGNVAGFPASALTAASILGSTEANRLRELAYSHVDNLFGRNPAGRHFSANAPRDFEGVELGWFQEYVGGAGNLANARGALDGSPKEAGYPYNAVAKPGYTEGWVAFNSAWNIALAYMAHDDTALTPYRDNYSVPSNHIYLGESLRVDLAAPLNFNYTGAETGVVHISTSGGDKLKLSLSETSANARNFRNAVNVVSGSVNANDNILQASAGDNITISYGYGFWGECRVVRVLSSGQTPPSSVAACSARQNTTTPTAPVLEGIIVDNSASTGVTITGSWATSTFEPSYIGANYLHDQNTGKGSKSVTFTPTIPTPGSYGVYLYWNASDDRANNVPIDIQHAGGTSTVTVNQTQNGGQWVLLNTYMFNTGTSGSVTIRTTGTNNYVIADAVKFVPIDLIVDNTDSVFVTVTGAWDTSSFEPARIGINYLHDQNNGKGSKSVRYNPNLPLTASYKVYAYWNSSSNRATNVPIDIQHSGGTSTVTVNQTQNGGQWVDLGTFDFNSGTSGHVTIRNTGTNGYIIADAVRFSPVAGGGSLLVELPVQETTTSTIVMNESFENGDNGWKNAKVVCNRPEKHFSTNGSCAVAVNQNHTVKQRIRQPNLQAGETVVFSAQVSGKRSVGAVISMTLKYADNTIEEVMLPIPEGTFNSQHFQQSVTLDKAVKRIDIKLKTTDGKLWIDDISLDTGNLSESGLLPLP